MKEKTNQEKETKKEGNTEIKENKMKKYRKFLKATVKIKLVKPMLGTDAGTPEVCLKHNVKQLNIFPRDTNGKIEFKPTWLRAGLRDTGGMYELSNNLATETIKCYGAKVIKQPTKVDVLTKAISPKDKGVKSGRITNYERVYDMEVELSFIFPSEGPLGIKPKLMESWLKNACTEGFGSYRKNEFGIFEIMDFQAKPLKI